MTLRTKLEARDAVFDATTAELFTSVQPALEVVLEYMEIEALHKRGGKMKWTDMVMPDKVGDDAIVILIGKVWYPIGTEMTLQGKKVIVTEENEDNFRQLVRVGLPMKLLESGNKEEIIGFLEKKAEQIKKEETEFRSELEAQVRRAMNKIQHESDTEGFDMSKLTDEQREQLKMFPTKVGNG